MDLEHRETLKQAICHEMSQAWKQHPHSQTLEHLHNAITWAYAQVPHIPANPQLLRQFTQTRPEFQACPPYPPQSAEDYQNYLDATETYLELLWNREYLTDHDHCTRRQQQKKWAWGLMSCLGVLLLLYPVFLWKQPIHVHRTHGQFFWQTPQMQQYYEDGSIWFNVLRDGQFHDYTLDLLIPIEVNQLRLDPVTGANAHIWIDWIEYYEEGQDTPNLIQHFQNQTHGWVPLQTLKLQSEPEMLYLQSTGEDPFMEWHEASFKKLKKIRIRMKAFSYQTYIQWLFS